MKYEKILVTGGAGFIGSHLVDRLISEDYEVKLLDDLSTGKKQNIQHHFGSRDFNFIRGDIRDSAEAQKSLRDIDVVYHLAAQVSVSKSISNPIETNDVNMMGTLGLLKSAVDAGVKRFIFSSSCAVYGEPLELPIKEASSKFPLSPYAVSKLAAEHYCRIYSKLYGLETVILRFFNVYGSRQTLSPYSGVVTIFIQQLANNDLPVIFGDGSQTRDFVHVQDAVQALLLAIKCECAEGEAYNIGTGKPTTINDLAYTILRIMGKSDLKPEYSQPRIGEIEHSYADVSKAQSVLCYAPKIGLKEGLTQLIKSTR